MKYCENCGSALKKGVKFCSSCGAEIKVANVKVIETITSTKTDTKDVYPIDFNAINKRVSIQNSQSKIVRRSRYAALFFFILMFLPFQEWGPFTGFWAMAIISFFLVIVSIIIGYVFRSRKKKLGTLISGENLLAHWELSPELQKQYVDTLYRTEIQKNKGILLLVGIIAAVVFGLFILTIDEAQFIMVLVYVGLMVLMSIFAFTMPLYYRYQNRRNDAQILIGAKYAYVNGYFHNWDFPLSGIKKASIINKPFYGLNLRYYYTDRTFTNTEELYIPAPEDFDLEDLLREIKNQ
jgi:hypothetical protein